MQIETSRKCQLRFRSLTVKREFDIYLLYLHLLPRICCISPMDSKDLGEMQHISPPHPKKTHIVQSGNSPPTYRWDPSRPENLDVLWWQIYAAVLTVLTHWGKGEGEVLILRDSDLTRDFKS